MCASRATSKRSLGTELVADPYKNVARRYRAIRKLGLSACLITRTYARSAGGATAKPLTHSLLYNTSCVAGGASAQAGATGRPLHRAPRPKLFRFAQPLRRTCESGLRVHTEPGAIHAERAPRPRGPCACEAMPRGTAARASTRLTRRNVQHDDVS